MSQDALSSNVSLCDAIDRILSKGVAVNGDISISVAGVDLLYIGLRGLLCSVDALGELPESLRGGPKQFAEELLRSDSSAAIDTHNAPCDTPHDIPGNTSCNPLASEGTQ